MGHHPHHLRQKGLVSGLLFLFLVLGARAEAGEAFPDWAQSAAQRDVSAWKDKYPAVVLSEEGQLELLPAAGRFRYRQRVVVRLFQLPTSARAWQVVAPFSGDERVTLLRGWTLTPAGKILPLDPKSVVDQSDFSGYELYNDVRLKQFVPSGLGPQSVFAYEYEKEGTLRIPGWDWRFGGEFRADVPTLQSKLEVRVPAGVSLRWRTYGPGNVRVAKDELTTRWEAADLKPLVAEEDMPSAELLLPRLVVSFNWGGQGAMESWDDMGRWFWNLYRGRNAVTPAIQQQVAQLTAGKQDPLQKIQALVEFVQRRVRYVAIEIGIGGYQPHPAEAVLKHQFGDCKDKVTLLAAMLSVAGFESYPALIGTRGGPDVDPAFPALRFDHVILALPAKGDLSWQMRKYWAYVAEPGFLWVDPTAERAPMGYLPVMDQGVYALVVRSDGTLLARTPKLEPAQNGFVREVKARIDGAGALTATATERYLGERSLRLKSAYSNRPGSEVGAWLEERLAGNGAVQLTDARMENMETNEGPATLQFTWNSPEYVTSMGKLLLMRPVPLSDVRRYAVPEQKRLNALEFDVGTTEKDEVEFTLPAGWHLDGRPVPVNIETEFGTYRLSMEVGPAKLKVSREFSLLRSFIPVEKLAAYREFIERVEAADGSQLIFRSEP